MNRLSLQTHFVVQTGTFFMSTEVISTVLIHMTFGEGVTTHVADNLQSLY